MDSAFLGFIPVFLSGIADLITNTPLFYFLGVCVLFSVFLLIRRIITWR